MRTPCDTAGMGERREIWIEGPAGRGIAEIGDKLAPVEIAALQPAGGECSPALGVDALAADCLLGERFRIRKPDTSRQSFTRSSGVFRLALDAPACSASRWRRCSASGTPGAVACAARLVPTFAGRSIVTDIVLPLHPHRLWSERPHAPRQMGCVASCGHQGAATPPGCCTIRSMRRLSLRGAALPAPSCPALCCLLPGIHVFLFVDGRVEPGQARP
jgi:hypothetical protein